MKNQMNCSSTILTVIVFCMALATVGTLFPQTAGYPVSPATRLVPSSTAAAMNHAAAAQGAVPAARFVAPEAVKAVYVTIAGAKQGTLGNGKLKVLKYLFYAASPRAGATGAPGSKMATGPLSITKAWDAASVLLLQAFETNELLSLVTVEFVGVDLRTGAERQLFTVRLRNASVASIKQTVDTTTSGALEEVDFAYQSIEVQDDTTRAIAATSPSAR